MAEHVCLAERDGSIPGPLRVDIIIAEAIFVVSQHFRARLNWFKRGSGLT
jgi:hypothetical protein